MLNRRRFLTASAAGLVAAPAIVRGQNLNSKLQIAAIGCDGKGWSDTKEMSTHAGVMHVAFCDVDLARTSQARMLNADAPVLQDYREMLAKFGPTIDAVTVSTADHAHAKITLDSMAAGKHVYCQKPLTHNVWEARQVKLGAAKYGVITRMGNQIHSHTFYRTAVREIQNGIIGKVRRIHSWCAATGHGKSGHISRPEPPMPPPETLNWDIWIAGAPMRPYAGGHNCYHPWGWRDWQDFGNGALGDFGCHILDPVFTALKITGAPIDMKADHSGMNDEVWPAQSQVDYTFPGTDLTTHRTLKLTWYDGGRLPTTKDSHIPETTALPRQGSIFIGEKGTLVLPHTGALRLYPQEQYAGVTIEPAEDLNHYHGWVDGCLTGKQPSDGFDYAGPLTEAVLLGNIAVRLRGETLTWDAAAMKITSHEAANKWLTREYRPGWEIAPVT